MAQPTQTFGPWLKQKLVEAGEISPDAQGVNLDPKVRDAYLKMWQNESKASSFQPTSVPVTNAVTQEVQAALMTSPNSATLMSDKQATPKLVPGKDGSMYAVDPLKGLATVVTNAQGEPFKADPKSSRAEALLGLLGQGQPEPEAAEPSLLSRWFGAGGVPVPSPTPAPTPMATPTPAATPAMTNAPAAVATPSAAPDLTTRDGIRAAFQAGAISEADAVRLLRGGR